MSIVTAGERLYKQPSERKKFTMDFTRPLDTSETITALDSVTSETLEGGASDLTIPAVGYSNTINSDANKILLWIEGGTSGNTYRIEVQVTTSSGQKLEGDGILRVTDI